MTRKLSSIYRDFAKTHANPDTDGNSLYHRAVMVNDVISCMLESFFKLTITEKPGYSTETIHTHLPGFATLTDFE